MSFRHVDYNKLPSLEKTVKKIIENLGGKVFSVIKTDVFIEIKTLESNYFHWFLHELICRIVEPEIPEDDELWKYGSSIQFMKIIKLVI